THRMTTGLTRIERVRGFLEAARLSEDWLEMMRSRAFVLEAHHTTHIEGTRLTLEQAERLLAGEAVAGTNPDDVQELLGRVDELFDDNPHGDEMNQSQKGLAQFLIPRGNASKLLEVVEESFHLLT